MTKSTKCPTPYKIAHPDESAARRHEGSLYRKEGKVAQIHAYKCRCGAWHLGGRRKKFGRKRRRR